MGPSFPILRWGYSLGLFKYFIKIAGIHHSAGSGNGFGALVTESQQFLGVGDALPQDIVAHGGAVESFELSRQVEFAEEKLFAELIQRQFFGKVDINIFFDGLQFTYGAGLAGQLLL